jgi:RNA polymerase sigma-70 factor (subfamily 1)
MDSAQDELLTRAIGGDRDALATLLTRHTPSLRQSLAGDVPRRWQSLLSVDDILQQIFTDAVLDISRFTQRAGADFSGWLITIARRNLQDVIRMLEADKRGGGRRPLPLNDPDESRDGLLELLSDSSTSPSGHAARNEAHAALAEAIDSLPEDHARVVRLYDLDGRSIQEVADELKRSSGAVYMLRARTHRWLRDILGRGSDFLSGSRE